jgi:Glycosyl hydrolases family 2, sugar binding domain
VVGKTAPRPQYPRPQFRREGWTNLNGRWHFAFDDGDAGLAARWQNTTSEDLGSDASPFDRVIMVPFCFQSELSGLGETAFHDVIWYARTFEYTPAGDERLLLRFGAVDYRAAVWVNGVQVASHEGGHTPFSADVTDAVAGEDKVNVLVVRAEDPSRDVTIPRGKQYWKEESEGIFYTRTTGIWQTEFGKEMPFADATSFGGMLAGPPDETTWLRLSHRIDLQNGEHEFRAASSRDGEHWIWGGTWTLPEGTMPRIGLISLGKRDPNDSSATARFDYFRVYRP